MQNLENSFSSAPSAPVSFESLRLEDFGALQARYHGLKLTHRAGAMLADAKPALQLAEEILQSLGQGSKTKQLFERIRKNSALIAKMRPSDAKTALLDGSVDFMDVTRKKIAAWRKTIERISLGEGIVVENSQEFLSSSNPLCAAVLSVGSLSHYLSVIQLAIAEQAKQDSANAVYYQSLTTKLRRCATVISDCESASSLSSLVH